MKALAHIADECVGLSAFRRLENHEYFIGVLILRLASGFFFWHYSLAKATQQLGWVPPPPEKLLITARNL